MDSSNSKNNIGEKIRKFRKRAGMSQMELELAIGASAGSISRIESGSVNPTKETIAQIGICLGITQIELANLYGVDPLESYIRILRTITKSLNVDDTYKLYQNAVNDLVFQLNLASAFIVIVDKDKIRCVGVTSNIITRMILKVLRREVTSFTAPLDSKENFMVETVLAGATVINDDVRKYLVPAITSKEANIVKKLTAFKSNISIPIQHEGQVLGAIMFGTREQTQFEDIKDILLEFGKAIGATMMRLDA